MADDLTLDFNPLHTIGFLATEWVEAHCLVPGGVFEGEPLTFRGWQLYCTANHYRVNPGATYDPRRLVEPFHYRRSVIVGPQKCGKSPWGAGMVLVEAVGPSLFAGWAVEGDRYRCEDHGCACGWEYDYLPGEAMGEPRRKSLIGLMAFSEDQTHNVYEPLQTMIHSGPLAEFVKVREGFVRLPNRGMILTLTAAMKSKLGRPLTAGLGDESGLYTGNTNEAWKVTQRGVTGMQGRTLELTNPWDPMEASAAQLAFESKMKDIFRYYRKPPVELKYTRQRDRSKIHDYVYADSPWVDPRAIDALADELMETDPTSAERFFGNRLVQGLGAFLTEEQWRAREAKVSVPDGTEVAGGMDGSRSGDWTAIRLETRDGYRFTPTYGPDDRQTIWNPAEWGGMIPRGEVAAAVDEIVRRFKVRRFYIDPRHWETQADAWAAEHGEDVFIQWPTYSTGRMFGALDRYHTDIVQSETTTHDADDTTAKLHALNARKVAKPGDKYILGKPSEHQKIDVCMSDVLAHEAASDTRAAGWPEDSTTYILTSSNTRRG